MRANAVNIPLADNSVHCVVTSPPYWGLRKYQGEQDTVWPDGTRCGYGLEPTIEQYVEHSLVILREVWRVLRDDGVCWWNLGDSYAAGGRGSSEHHVEKMGLGTATAQNMGPKIPTDGLKPLDLCLIPERVALAAQADAWYVRSIVCWTKPNPMPESVNGWRWERHRVKVEPGKTGRTSIEKPGYSLPESVHPDYTRPSSVAQWADCPGCEKCLPNDGLVLRKGSWRPTDAYEHILMLAKTADYFGDAEAVKENGVYAAGEQRGPGEHKSLESGSRTTAGLHDKTWTGNGTRNLRNVWRFPTQPYPEAHFATFPERLPEICIKASTSERGCCLKCGANWVRVIEPSRSYQEFKDAERLRRGPMRSNDLERLGLTGGTSNKSVSAEIITKGWRPSCSCDAGEPVPCTVLDPFGGSGTTARVALKLNRRAVSIDLAYHGLSDKRTRNVQRQLIGV